MPESRKGEGEIQLRSEGKGGLLFPQLRGDDWAMVARKVPPCFGPPNLEIGGYNQRGSAYADAGRAPRMASGRYGSGTGVLTWRLQRAREAAAGSRGTAVQERAGLVAATRRACLGRRPEGGWRDQEERGGRGPTCGLRGDRAWGRRGRCVETALRRGPRRDSPPSPSGAAPKERRTLRS